MWASRLDCTNTAALRNALAGWVAGTRQRADRVGPTVTSPQPPPEIHRLAARKPAMHWMACQLDCNALACGRTGDHRWL